MTALCIKVYIIRTFYTQQGRHIMVNLHMGLGGHFAIHKGTLDTNDEPWSLDPPNNTGIPFCGPLKKCSPSRSMKESKDLENV